MSDRKPCVKCGRTIDAYARICPFCNWDQDEPIVAQAAAPVEGPLPEYHPPADLRWRKPLFSAVGGVLAVILAFVIGVHVHGRKPPETVPGKEAPPPVATANARPAPRANVRLVPDDGASPVIEEPITSAPNTQTAQGVPNELQRTDATAVSSDEYAQMAQRAKAEKKRMAALVDPRSVAGIAYQPVGAAAIPRPAARPSTAAPPPMYSSAPEPSRAMRTGPVPESQPLPRIHVPVTTVARLQLMIDAEGRVRDVNVQQGLGPETGTLIASVQRWKFKPATMNGQPVPSAFAVELSFHADE